jgi:hypothetical protein
MLGGDVFEHPQELAGYGVLKSGFGGFGWGDAEVPLLDFGALQVTRQQQANIHVETTWGFEIFGQGLLQL